jgi:peptide/nickel transport system substrate-binding protein
MGRVPIGGKLEMSLPWSTAQIDPHDLFDPLAALFGATLFDSVYARDANGKVFATLADGMPRVENGRTVVRLRNGLRSASGKTLGGRDLAWSITRARSMGASGLLAALPPFARSDKDQPLIARFGDADPDKLALLLSSPLCALVPHGFKPSAPDGTGAFAASVSSSKLELTRNRNAARGPSYIERIVVRSVPDMADSLRSFEAGRTDVGWLGLGLHKNRSGAYKFDFGVVGWAVLVTGKGAARFGAPGAAQQLANGVPLEKLHVGLDARPGVGGGGLWLGGPAPLLFAAGSGQLRAIAEAVADKLSQNGHELKPTEVSPSRLRQLRLSEDFTLAIDVVRHPGAGPMGPAIALATADRPTLGRDIAQHPPRIAYDRPAHLLTSTLRLGVLGGLAMRGGVRGGVQLAADRSARGWDLGSAYITG